MAVFEKHSQLAVTDNELRPQFEIGGTFLRDTVNHFGARRVHPFDNFDKYRHGNSFRIKKLEYYIPVFDIYEKQFTAAATAMKMNVAG
jgi:hypothetical protein